MKPRCKFVGKDGNIFNLIDNASNTLINVGMKDKAKEMIDRILNTKSCMEAIDILLEYVEIEYINIL
ncbi:hypothetical protein NE686_03860 [Tissierella carlieri]|uniref:Uncharacterized protein n=1 Tax=Tissierella carlieri TaxID=689904 RepID=A0ABT1S6W4_9FIRM|nr:hypothetical protein [Tissierella carlieri]MCQ4922206.1 hypothetical protein [Tissierella carlieri]